MVQVISPSNLFVTEHVTVHLALHRLMASAFPLCWTLYSVAGVPTVILCFLWVWEVPEVVISLQSQ